MKYTDLLEEDIVKLLNNGDEGAFMEIYSRYRSLLAMNLLRLLKDPDLVEEVLQDVFMALWEKRRAIDPKQSLGGYLFRIGVNKSKNIFRRLAYDQRMREALWANLEVMQERSAHDILEEKETNEIVAALLDYLPPQQRKVYRLCKIEGMSYKEVGELLSISETTVNSHIRNANRFLRAEVNKSASIFLHIILFFISFAWFFLPVCI